MQYVVLQVEIADFHIAFGGWQGSKYAYESSELGKIINEQAANGYRLHTITTNLLSAGKGMILDNVKFLATLVFEKLETSGSSARSYNAPSSNSTTNSGTVFREPQKTSSGPQKICEKCKRSVDYDYKSYPHCGNKTFS